MTSFILIFEGLLIIFAYIWGTYRAKKLVLTHSVRLKSLPHYHGVYVLLCTLIPTLIFFGCAYVLESIVLEKMLWESLSEELQSQHSDTKLLLFEEIKNVANAVINKDLVSSSILDAAIYYQNIKNVSSIGMLAACFILSLAGLLYGISQITISFKAREKIEAVVQTFLKYSAGIAVLITFGIFASLIFETIRFFQMVPITEFLFGLNWQPQIAIRHDQVGSSGAFGAVPLFVGTLLISLIAMLVAGPLGLMSAIYLSEYASRPVRAIAKPTLEILAGIPTVVYGFFAALVVSPFIRDLGLTFGLNASAESALAAGLVMGIMIIPFISSLSDDIINAVPQTLRDASYALGSTKSETIKKVVFPTALPGIIGAFLLAVSRAIGETMIVVMAAGLAAKLTFNPFENVTTATVQIVTTLVGDQEFNSPKTLSAFALGLMLFLITLFLNFISYRIVERFKEQYE